MTLIFFWEIISLPVGAVLGDLLSLDKYMAPVKPLTRGEQVKNEALTAYTGHIVNWGLFVCLFVKENIFSIKHLLYQLYYIYIYNI